MIEIFSETEYRFEPPSGLNIYRLRRPESGETALRRVGSRFGLRTTYEAGSVRQDARGISFAEPNGWALRLFRQSGGWQYRHATLWQADDGKSHLHIEDEDAARLALDAMRAYALPTAPDLEVLRVQRLHVAHAQRDGANHEQRVAGARVFLRRLIEGVPVEGPGGRTVVYLDHQRQLTGIDHLWHDIEAVHEPVTSLRPVGEALEEVRRRYGSGHGRIEVLDIRLGYFESGWDQEQEYLQPAYVVTAKLHSTNERVRMNTVVPVAAAANAVGPVEPVPVPPKPQPVRAR